MTRPELPAGLSVVDLTQQFTLSNLDTFTQLANTIPLVDYEPEEIISEQKGDRKLHGKWLHGLAIVKPDTTPIAFIAAYERESEGNDQYPMNTLYISELAVKDLHRKKGLAKILLSKFITKNNKSGFHVLTGELNYSVQTNAADWNQPVIDIYKSFGFEQRALKQYDNRTDVVLGRRSNV